MIFPGWEAIDALKMQDEAPDNQRLLLHVEKLVDELLLNVRKEVLNNGLRSEAKASRSKNRSRSRS